jgi:hypothetical protein
MGCANGGFPYCSEKNFLYCKDGTHLDRTKFLTYKLDGRVGCVCKDGIMPRCKDTGETFKCPNGDDVDWSLGGPDELKSCKVEYFDSTIYA